MNLKTYTYQYAFDQGLNLLQRTASSGQTRMIAAAHSNRTINRELYSALGLNPTQEAGLNNTFINEGIFDKGGNQLKSVANSGLGWDYRSMLVNTVTDRKNDEGATIGQLNEYNLYAKTGKRNRKITEKTDASGNIVEIQEALYLNNLEYRSTWIGSNLSYDGEIVSENGASKTPEEAYVALRIRQGHKTVSEKRVYTFKGGSLVSETASFFSLDNNIDSCEMQLNSQGNLESYYASKPYGETAISYGKVKLHPYKYSGQEKDQSGLYYYGYRSLLPQNFRWMSPDPAGVQGSGLNWYAMVNGNPITMRDEFGLLSFAEFLRRGLTMFGLVIASIVVLVLLIPIEVVGVSGMAVANLTQGNLFSRNHYRDFNDVLFGTEDRKGALTRLYRTRDKTDILIDMNRKKQNEFFGFDNAVTWAYATVRGISYYNIDEAGKPRISVDQMNPEFLAYWDELRKEMERKGNNLNIVLAGHGRKGQSDAIWMGFFDLGMAMDHLDALDFRNSMGSFCSCNYGQKKDPDFWNAKLKFAEVKQTEGGTALYPWWRGVNGTKPWVKKTRAQLNRAGFVNTNEVQGINTSNDGNELAIELQPIRSVNQRTQNVESTHNSSHIQETENLHESPFVE